MQKEAETSIRVRTVAEGQLDGPWHRTSILEKTLPRSERTGQVFVQLIRRRLDEQSQHPATLIRPSDIRYQSLIN